VGGCRGQCTDARPHLRHLLEQGRTQRQLLVLRALQGHLAHGVDAPGRRLVQRGAQAGRPRSRQVHLRCACRIAGDLPLVALLHPLQEPPQELGVERLAVGGGGLAVRLCAACGERATRSRRCAASAVCMARIRSPRLPPDAPGSAGRPAQPSCTLSACNAWCLGGAVCTCVGHPGCRGSHEPAAGVPGRADQRPCPCVRGSQSIATLGQRSEETLAGQGSDSSKQVVQQQCRNGGLLRGDQAVFTTLDQRPATRRRLHRSGQCTQSSFGVCLLAICIAWLGGAWICTRPSDPGPVASRTSGTPSADLG
jgi:hypothetical protein